MDDASTPALAPYLMVSNARGLVRFLEQVLGGRVVCRHDRHDGSLGHTEVRIADSLVMLADAPQGHAPSPAVLHLRVPDADETFARALEAGATPVRAPEGTSQGDRRASIRDAWGNEWWLSTPVPAVLASLPEV